jgi:hypothetical protein
MTTIHVVDGHVVAKYGVVTVTQLVPLGAEHRAPPG